METYSAPSRGYQYDIVSTARQLSTFYDSRRPLSLPIVPLHCGIYVHPLSPSSLFLYLANVASTRHFRRRFTNVPLSQTLREKKRKRPVYDVSHVTLRGAPVFNENCPPASVSGNFPRPLPPPSPVVTVHVHPLHGGGIEKRRRGV